MDNEKVAKLSIKSIYKKMQYFVYYLADMKK